MAACKRPALGVVVLLALLGACSRRAEIADDSEGTYFPPSSPAINDEVHSVDVGFGTDAFVDCAERPGGSECRGANDFPCNFQPWVVATISACQIETGCVSNGRVVVRMGADGCVDDLRMSEPNEAFAECAAQRFGAVRCTCGAQEVEELLGFGNDGCPDAEPQRCGTGEIRCAPPTRCIDGYCLEEPSAE